AAQAPPAVTTVTTQPPAPTTSAIAPADTAPPPTLTIRAVRPPSAPAPRPQLPPGPPPGSVSVAAIGDSVMLGAAGPLQARLGPSAYIDAKISRQFADGVNVARQLREQGRLGEVAIVHLGTNGPPKASEVDSLARELGPVPHVLLVTVRVNQRWEGPTNQTL